MNPESWDEVIAWVKADSERESDEDAEALSPKAIASLCFFAGFAAASGLEPPDRVTVDSIREAMAKLEPPPDVLYLVAEDVHRRLLEEVDEWAMRGVVYASRYLRPGDVVEVLDPELKRVIRGEMPV